MKTLMPVALLLAAFAAPGFASDEGDKIATDAMVGENTSLAGSVPGAAIHAGALAKSAAGLKFSVPKNVCGPKDVPSPIQKLSDAWDRHWDGNHWHLNTNLMGKNPWGAPATGLLVAGELAGFAAMVAGLFSPLLPVAAGIMAGTALLGGIANGTRDYAAGARGLNLLSSIARGIYNGLFAPAWAGAEAGFHLGRGIEKLFKR